MERKSYSFKFTHNPQALWIKKDNFRLVNKDIIELSTYPQGPNSNKFYKHKKRLMENTQKCAEENCEEDGIILWQADGKLYCLEHADAKLNSLPPTSSTY